MTGIDESLLIHAPAERAFDAFFDPAALTIWWRTTHAVTMPRALGVYAVQWQPSSRRDDIFGPLGGVFHGRVIDVAAGREVFVADAWWIPPESDAVGPMALHVTFTPDAGGCRVRVRQHGGDRSPRWTRYYELVGAGWRTALGALKEYLERDAEGPN